MREEEMETNIEQNRKKKSERRKEKMKKTVRQRNQYKIKEEKDRGFEQVSRR